MSGLLGGTWKEDDFPAALYDGRILCQLMTLYLKKRGHAGVAIRKENTTEADEMNLRSDVLFNKNLMIFALESFRLIWILIY